MNNKIEIRFGYFAIASFAAGNFHDYECADMLYDELFGIYKDVGPIN